MRGGADAEDDDNCVHTDDLNFTPALCVVDHVLWGLAAKRPADTTDDNLMMVLQHVLLVKFSLIVVPVAVPFKAHSVGGPQTQLVKHTVW
jgi:hypothetical protein